jgi:hypothetical protein
MNIFPKRFYQISDVIAKAGELWKERFTKYSHHVDGIYVLILHFFSDLALYYYMDVLSIERFKEPVEGEYHESSPKIDLNVTGYSIYCSSF